MSLDEKDTVVIDGSEYSIEVVKKFVEMMNRDPFDVMIDVEWLIKGSDGDRPKWLWTMMVAHLGTFYMGYKALRSRADG